MNNGRLGEINTNTYGTVMKIISYKKSNDVIIEFQDKYKYRVATNYTNFKKGTISNPYSKTICGVGYIGDGEYQTHVGIKNIEPYITWKDMISRCYNENQRHKHPAYIDCTVCDEWLNYQNFAKWYEENYYDIGEGRMHIDKDILVKDNKIYSPETCIFVPQRINMIFMKKNREIDKDLPTGIRRYEDKFQAYYNTIYLGIFDKLDDALMYYNIEKQIHINEVAEEYKNVIPLKLYKALINWNINI